MTNQLDAAGYAPGETPESFRRASRDSLEIVAQFAGTEARRKLADAELERRRLAGR